MAHQTQLGREGLAGRLTMFLILAFGAVAVLTASPDAASAAKGKKLVWKSCGKKAKAVPRARCAFLSVPQNYKKPGGKKFRLAMAKVSATGKKRGSLFFNPGGPGASGVESVLEGITTILPRSIRRNFDFVSWDPRGVGATRPAVRGCEPSPTPLDSLPDTGTATDQQWLQVLSKTREENRQAARACLPKNRGFTRHMGTRNVVRDLDRMRAAVGDRKLTYWGASYGTRIGYTYALTYPKRLRAILLDGSVNPAGGFRDFGRVRAQATDRALKVIRQVRPAFGDRIIATRDDLRVNGPVSEGGVEFTQWAFENFVSLTTFSQAQWPEIQEVMDAVDALRAAPSPTQQRRKAGDKIREALEQIEESPFFAGSSQTSSAGDDEMTLRIINHLDYADSTLTVEASQGVLLDNVRDFPFASGPPSAFFATTSEGLGSLKPQPVPQTSNRKNASRAATLGKIMISGSTGDGATPFVWTEQMASAFKQAALIRYDGWTHVNWMAIESPCVNNRINRFLLTGKKPSPLRPPLCPFAPPAPPSTG